MISIKKINITLIGLFFLLMSVIPANQEKIKIILLSLILFLFIIDVNTNIKIINNLFVNIWFAILLLYGLIWSVYGIVMGQENAIGYFRLYFIWPAVYYVLIMIMVHYVRPQKIEKIFKISVILISFYNMNYILNAMGYMSIDFLVGWDEYELFGVHPGYTQLNNQNIGSLIFISPFLLSYFLIKGVKKLKIFDFLILLLLIVNILLAGRRALVLTTLLAVPLTYMLLAGIIGFKNSASEFLKISLRISFIVLCVLGLYFGFVGFDASNFIDRFTFNNAESIGLEYRFERSLLLIQDAYNHNILIGVGGGGVGFEVKYIMVLHQTGIFGLLIYLGLLFVALCGIIYLMNKRRAYSLVGIPFVVGFICFMVGDGINPLSGSFDFMWMLFISMYFIYYISSRHDVSMQERTSTHIKHV